MKNKYLRWLLKILSAILSFVIVYVCLGEILIPKFMDESTTMNRGLEQIEDNSLDVLFLGSSQMFCSIDAKSLSEEYNISAYDYGASGQPLTVTEYYLNEALKSQKPKLVMVEIATITHKGTELSDQVFIWSYAPTNPSIEKFQSIMSVTKNNLIKSFQYCYLPLIAYHSRWNSLGKADFVNTWKEYFTNQSANRGFLARTEVTNITPHQKETKETDLTIPKENLTSIERISNICEENDIKLIFFKSPAYNWTLSYQRPIDMLMKAHDYDYIDLNKEIDQIGLDWKYDCYDEGHLNKYGAEKTTAYLAELIKPLI